MQWAFVQWDIVQWAFVLVGFCPSGLLSVPRESWLLYFNCLPDVPYDDVGWSVVCDYGIP